VYALESVFGTSTACVSVCVGECVRDFNSVCECMRWGVCSGLQRGV